MTITVARLTVAEAATILNAIISFIQYTLGLAIVAILANTIVSSAHAAITWSVVARTLHASLWPTLLRADSSHGAAPRVALLSNLGLVSTVLIAMAGVVTPLGLKTGPLVASRNVTPMNAVYIEDTSPLASATYPRSQYFYSRACGAFNPVACPGNTDPNTTVINPAIIDMFNSTPHGPFTMQYRQYYTAKFGIKNISSIQGQFSTLESFILQDGIFAVEGAIVDLTDTPGIGLTNHTMPPSLTFGGIWSQEMLWLEPATTCVDTNLTIDYSYGMPLNAYGVDALHLTDRGGFVDLPTQDPFFNFSGQNVNLYQHAYAGAVFSNRYSMSALNLNLTRNQSSIGKAYSLDTQYIIPGIITTSNLRFLVAPDNVTDTFSPDIICAGYGGQDAVNNSIIGVHCGTFLGPPYRTDGGHDNSEDVGSMWRQNLLVCASATKVSIQRVDYSLNGTANLANLNITRSPIEEPVLWAVEKATGQKLVDVTTIWGRVADSYEIHPNLTTIRAKEFYIPASSADEGLDSGLASDAHALAWGDVYSLTKGVKTVDYSGSTNAALLKKYQSLISSNSTQGIAQICNLIWTDILANYLLSIDTSTVLMVAEYHPSITFDLRYGIPLILLIAIWLPSFAITLISLVLGKLKFRRFRNLLNHTSIGTIITGHSGFTISSSDGDKPAVLIPANPSEDSFAAAAGQILVTYNHWHAKIPVEHDDLLDFSEKRAESQGVTNDSEAKR